MNLELIVIPDHPCCAVHSMLAHGVMLGMLQCGTHCHNTWEIADLEV